MEEEVEVAPEAVEAGERAWVTFVAGRLARGIRGSLTKDPDPG
jgi:microcompartment protein CcmK/EutM